MTLKIYNVLSRKKEDFIPLTDGNVKMYACGITVSGDAHIGHAYQSIVFDMITRYLKYRGLSVNYARNYTDVDDKIIAAAAGVNENPISFAERFIQKTNSEMDALGNIRPTIEPRATQSIPQIIDFVNRLIAKGNAYSTESGDVYFKLSTFPEYGKLSRIKIDKNEVAVRKDLEPGKIDSGDFALWKSAKPGEISWESPWGMGRPGWHIECSAMNLANLGEQIDIHGGGRDLIFPHHENEIAQTEALTGKQFANFWIHCGLIKINGQKMSKSLGNGILIQDMLERYEPDVIRFALLRNNYATDIDVNDNFFKDSEVQIYKMYSTFAKIPTNVDGADSEKTDALILGMVSEFETAMDDNFNTSAAFAVVYKYINLINSEIIKPKSVYDLEKIGKKLRELLAIFNILQRNPISYIKEVREKILRKNNISETEINDKIEKRNVAKSNKDFITSDALRGELAEKGIVLKDTQNGTEWDVEIG